MPNHHDVLTHDSFVQIWTLFTDLVQSDARDPISSVCKILRKGPPKTDSNMGIKSENLRRPVIWRSYNRPTPSRSSGRSSNSADHSGAVRVRVQRQT